MVPTPLDISRPPSKPASISGGSDSPTPSQSNTPPIRRSSRQPGSAVPNSPSNPLFPANPKPGESLEGSGLVGRRKRKSISVGANGMNGMERTESGVSGSGSTSASASASGNGGIGDEDLIGIIKDEEEDLSKSSSRANDPSISAAKSEAAHPTASTHNNAQPAASSPSRSRSLSLTPPPSTDPPSPAVPSVPTNKESSTTTTSHNSKKRKLSQSPEVDQPRSRKKLNNNGGNTRRGKRRVSISEKKRVEQEEEEEEENEGEDEEGWEGETRCICGETESTDLMIQCDSCKNWQHALCYGFETNDSCPDTFFCRDCEELDEKKRKNSGRDRADGTDKDEEEVPISDVEREDNEKDKKAKRKRSRPPVSPPTANSTRIRTLSPSHPSHSKPKGRNTVNSKFALHSDDIPWSIVAIEDGEITEEQEKMLKQLKEREKEFMMAKVRRRASKQGKFNSEEEEEGEKEEEGTDAEKEDEEGSAVGDSKEKSEKEREKDKEKSGEKTDGNGPRGRGGNRRGGRGGRGSRKRRGGFAVRPKSKVLSEPTVLEEDEDEDKKEEDAEIGGDQVKKEEGEGEGGDEEKMDVDEDDKDRDSNKDKEKDISPSTVHEEEPEYGPTGRPIRKGRGIKRKLIDSEGEDEGIHNNHGKDGGKNEKNEGSGAAKRRRRATKKKEVVVINDKDVDQEEERAASVLDNAKKPSRSITPVAPMASSSLIENPSTDSLTTILTAGPNPSRQNNNQKPRHPNQYTYTSSNPKPTPRKSGNTKSSPKKQKGRGAATIDVQGGEEWVEGMAGWGLPDHLKNLEGLLEKEGPKKLLVRTFMTVDVSNSNGESSASRATTKLVPDPSKSLEFLPSKIKWPAKRTSMNDVKKRVKNLMDYMGKLQIEMVKREGRNRLLFGEDYLDESEKEGREEIRGMGDELMKELVKFNEKFFGAGGSKGKERER